MNTIYFVPKEGRLVDAVQALQLGRFDLALPAMPNVDAAAAFGAQLGVQFFLSDYGIEGDKAPVAYLTNNTPGMDDGTPLWMRGTPKFWSDDRLQRILDLAHRWVFPLRPPALRFSLRDAVQLAGDEAKAGNQSGPIVCTEMGLEVQPPQIERLYRMVAKPT